MKSINLISNKNLSVRQSFLAVAKCKLNIKEKTGLKFMARNKSNNATQAAKALSINLDCAESTGWSILRSLRSLNLIEYSRTEKQQLVLSKAGKFLLREGLC